MNYFSYEPIILAVAKQLLVLYVLYLDNIFSRGTQQIQWMREIIRRHRHAHAHSHMHTQSSPCWNWTLWAILFSTLGCLGTLCGLQSSQSLRFSSCYRDYGYPHLTKKEAHVDYITLQAQNQLSRRHFQSAYQHYFASTGCCFAFLHAFIVRDIIIYTLNIIQFMYWCWRSDLSNVKLLVAHHFWIEKCWNLTQG